MTETRDDDRPVAASWIRRVNPMRVLAYGLMPGLVLLLAIAAGLLKWQDVTSQDADAVRAESTEFASDSTIAILSYSPDTVDADVAAARELVTDGFRDSYLQLAHDRVIPDAKDRHITATVSVSGTASVSAGASHAVVLVFADQTRVSDSSRPVEVPASFLVTLDYFDGRWLVSDFEPV